MFALAVNKQWVSSEFYLEKPEPMSGISSFFGEYVAKKTNNPNQGVN